MSINKEICKRKMKIKTQKRGCVLQVQPRSTHPQLGNNIAKIVKAKMQKEITMQKVWALESVHPKNREVNLLQRNYTIFYEINNY